MKLNKFIVEAKKNTYASNKKSKSLKDGTQEFIFKDKNFKYRDRYYGNNPFVGQEIVWKNKKIIWSMNYYGYIYQGIKNKKAIYDFLKKALNQVSVKQIFRGPNNFEFKNFKYLNKNKGSLDKFSGEEKILNQGKTVYRLYYHGGAM